MQIAADEISEAEKSHNVAALTLVEDEACMRDVLLRAARAWRYSCQAATNAEQAIELLEQHPTPVVVTDLRMPGRGGVWLVREIQRRWPGTGIIVITAGDDNDAAMECLNAGADRYFLKPINLEEFRHALATTLHTVHLEQERERYRSHLERTVQRQMRRVRRTFISAIDSLVRTLEARHPYTKGHSLRARGYALRLAKSIHCDARTLKQLSLAAKLHDIGKIGTPDDILNKPAMLTPAEVAIIREHTIVGERILKPIIQNPKILAAIRGHHERLDGQGYPDGLRGDGVPFLARIIAIADTFDALTSSRAYREAMPVGKALQIIQAEAGKQFDAELVGAFMKLEWK